MTASSASSSDPSIQPSRASARSTSALCRPSASARMVEWWVTAIATDAGGTHSPPSYLYPSCSSLPNGVDTLLVDVGHVAGSQIFDRGAEPTPPGSRPQRCRPSYPQ